MIDARTYASSGSRTIDSTEIAHTIDDERCLLWVDVCDPHEDDLACLEEQFSLHFLAMEDVRHRQQRPKLARYPDHTFLVAKTPQLQDVDVFVGPSWVITVREMDDDDHVWSLDEARARYERFRDAASLSPGFLVYVLLDTLVDGYLDALDASEEPLERLESTIFSQDQSAEIDIQRSMYQLRENLLRLRRALAPLREVVSTLLRREEEWVDDVSAIHLQDVLDHVLRATDQLDTQRELLGNAVDAHLAVMSNRMNAVMKRMTSWGAILLGASLVAGIYGMNFEHMPELEWYLGYAWALGIMATITVVGYLWFKRKDWL